MLPHCCLGNCSKGALGVCCTGGNGWSACICKVHCAILLHNDKWTGLLQAPVDVNLQDCPLPANEARSPQCRVCADVTASVCDVVCPAADAGSGLVHSYLGSYQSSRSGPRSPSSSTNLTPALSAARSGPTPGAVGSLHFMGANTAYLSGLGLGLHILLRAHEHLQYCLQRSLLIHCKANRLTNACLCTQVREACSILDLDVLFYPCPKDGPNWRPKVSFQAWPLNSADEGHVSSADGLYRLDNTNLANDLPPTVLPCHPV